MNLTTSLTRQKGRQLPELLELLKDEKARYCDYLVGVDEESGGLRAELLPFVGEDGAPKMVPGLVFTIDGREYHVIPTNSAQGQLCDRTLGVRKAYDKIAVDCPANLPPILNHYLQAANGKRRLIRCYAVSEDVLLCRGILSDAYRVLDNRDVAITALEGAKIATDEQGFAPPRVKDWSLSEQRFDLTLFSPDIWTDLKDEGGDVHVGNTELPSTVGMWLDRKTAGKLTIEQQGGRDILFAGFRVRNSETGNARLSVTLCGFRLHCANGQVVGSLLAQIHIGAKRGEEMILRPETLAADNAITFQKVRDAVGAAFLADKFRELVAKVRGLKEVAIKKPAEAISAIVEREKLSEDVEKDLLAAYESGGKPTAFDLYQAVTSVQGDVESEDTADALERVAVALANKDNKVLAAVRAA